VGPEELLRLGRRLSFLTGGPRDLPARQQTLRSTIACSHDLLDDSERRLFARLGVFAAGFRCRQRKRCAHRAGMLEAFFGVWNGVGVPVVLQQRTIKIQRRKCEAH
jgi:predicted ATPase